MAAETILYHISKTIIGKLTDLAMEQVALLRTLKIEILKLKDTVKTIHAVLLDAEEKQNHNHEVKVWLEKLSGAMYDADDLLDDLSTEALRQAMVETDDISGTRSPTTACWSMVCFLFSFLPKRLMYDLKMAHDIKEIREKLDGIKNDREFHLDELPEKDLPLRETDSCPPTIVVGRKDDKENIIWLLLNANCEANISVVPIVGIGGLGKTTLAQLVFDDDRVKAHFAIKVWVYVSQSFDIKVILEKILRSITRKSEQGIELDVLQDELRKELTGKRFLFALDDVWEENVQSWETLAKYLIVGAPGSKVLVTTRSTMVAEVGGRSLKLETSTEKVVHYHLEGLSLDESWTLLLIKALNGKIPRIPDVESIGRKILGKCYGVPLVINTISGLLSSKNAETEWQPFLENNLGSINREEKDIMLTLKLSYNHLPSHVKHCFAYCKLFPKGHKFDVQRLVQFWVAQGYTKSQDNGLRCFKTLWWRSFFYELKTDEFGNMATCRMHDLMHDLADSIGGEKFQRISCLSDAENITSNTRHLALLKNGDDILVEAVENVGNWGNATKVRTLICFRYLSWEECEFILLNYRRLRVLTMLVEGIESDTSAQLHYIGKLKHLRCLGISFNVIKQPPSGTDSFGMESLFEEESVELELPRDIRKLVNLEHLYLDSKNMKSFIHMPERIGLLKSLQTLPFFVVGQRSRCKNDTVGARLDELKELDALRGQLIITNLANVKLEAMSIDVLKNKQYLQSLDLDWGNRHDAHDEEILEMLEPHPNLKKLCIRAHYGGVKFPNWHFDIMSLMDITLESCGKCVYLPPVHLLPCLKNLTIRNCPEMLGINEYEDDDCPRFHCLAYLTTEDCPKLTQLPAFPAIEGSLILVNSSLKPLVRTMEMRRGRGRGGGVHYSDKYTTKIGYDDDDTVPHFPCTSSTFIRPLSNLKKLSLKEIDDDLQSLPDDDFSSRLISLQELRLIDCRRGLKVPNSLCCSTSLTAIYISNCKAIEYLPPLHELPSLAELQIYSCPELKGCSWKQQGNNGDDYYWPHFPRLSTLVIADCPNLDQFPLFPTVEGRLRLCRVSGQALVRTMKMKATAHHLMKHTTPTTSSSCSSSSVRTVPLSKLTHLIMEEINDLESLPDKGLCNLSSLQELSIVRCRRLKSLPPTLRHLTFLQSLIVEASYPLAERCRKEWSEDWSNSFPHRRSITLNGELVSRDYSDNTNPATLTISLKATFHSTQSVFSTRSAFEMLTGFYRIW